MDGMYMGAYWGPRAEALERCAHRLRRFLESISRWDSTFSTWYGLGRSRRDALAVTVDTRSQEAIVRLLHEGRNRNDTDGGVIESLGFSVGLWNGQTTNPLSLRVSCGLYDPNPLLKNALVLDLPFNSDEMTLKERCIDLLTGTVRTWEPEWAGVISRQSSEARPHITGEPFVDWMLYVNRARLDAAKLPGSAHVRAIEGAGTLIVAQDKPVDPSNARHLSNVRMIEHALGLRL